MTSLLTDAEKYQKIKEQNRLRQRAYYQRNKDFFTQAKREATKLIQANRGVQPTANNAIQAEPIPEPIQETIQEPEPERLAVPVPKKIRIAKKRVIGKNYSEIENAWKQEGMNGKSLQTNLNQLNNLYSVLDTDKKDVLNLLQPEYTIAKIKNAKNGDKLYSVASVIKAFQTLLRIIHPHTGEPLVIVDEPLFLQYKVAYEGLQKIQNDTTSKKKETEQIGDWDELYNAVKKDGENTKGFVYLSIYREVKGRDDLQLYVVKSYEETTADKNRNYLVLPEDKSKSGLIIIQKYKTEASYGVKNIKITPQLCGIIRAYKSFHGYNQYLFGKQLNSGFVGGLLEKYGLKVKNQAVNTLRKMLTNKLGEGITSVEDEARLAQEFGHSLATREATYKRNAPRRRVNKQK